MYENVYNLVLSIMLIPTKENIQKIFHTHQNQCALLKCHKKIIDEDGHINGNIYFIESNIKGKPRYNSELTNEQMIDYHNLILLCDIHGLDIEWKERKYTISKLSDEILLDQETLSKQNFELSDKIFENTLSNFIDYHDPDRFSHMTLPFVYNFAMGHSFTELSSTGIYIKPTKHFIKGKFEIVDTRRKIQVYDKVIFYPKNLSYLEGVQADIEIKSKMSILGEVPQLPEGKYLISLRSALDETSKLENDLEFTVLD